MSEKEIVIQELNDWLSYKINPNSYQHEVEEHIKEGENELKHLDPNSEEQVVLKNKVQTKIRELKTNIKSNKYSKRPFPPELYSKDLDTKVKYLNDNFIYECPVCKNNNLRLVKSGKIWMCPNRCGGKQFLTSEEKIFLNITYKND